MTVWLDNQLPPALAAWMSAATSIECVPVRELNLQRASDSEIFAAARSANVIVMTKDADFVELLEQQGPPPQVARHLRKYVERAPAIPGSGGIADYRRDARTW